LPKGTQRLPRGYVPEAGNGKVSKRQKHNEYDDSVDKRHLKRDGAALIGYQSLFAAPNPTSTDTNPAHDPICT
jgi:hypothetical protein